MSATITPAENGLYVVVTVAGDMTRETANQYMMESNVLAAELGIRCYLFDMVDSRNVESALDNFKFNTDLRSAREVDRRACVAVLTAADDHSHDLYVTLAQAAGLDISLFRDRAEAIAHLEAAAERFQKLAAQEQAERDQDA